MIRSWLSQIISYNLPKLPAGTCDLLLSPSPLEVCSRYGMRYGEVLRVHCRCQPIEQYIGDRPDEESARFLWSVHKTNRRNNGSTQTGTATVS